VNPYCRAALFLIRLVAIGLVVTGLMLLAGDVVNWMARSPVATRTWVVPLEVLLMIIGALLLLRSRKLAHRFTEQFDDVAEKSLEELLDSDDES
jgi:small-conductance mechanosensitive channel